MLFIISLKSWWKEIKQWIGSNLIKSVQGSPWVGKPECSVSAYRRGSVMGKAREPTDVGQKAFFGAQD